MPLITHDLQCTLAELGVAACVYADAAMRLTDNGAGLKALGLLRASVAYTIQLAIEAGEDAVQMRALETRLLAIVDDAGKKSKGS